MEQVEPIRHWCKVPAINKIVKGHEHPRDRLLFVMGMNYTDKKSGSTTLSRNARRNPDLHDIVVAGDRNHCCRLDFTHYVE